MTLFFLVVGLEAKRQLDLGELRERRRLAIPVFAALGGIFVPIAIFLAFNAGRAGSHGWGAAMSTDTAFALGALGLLAPRSATRMRVFLLTLAVVDDLAALLVIAVAYTAMSRWVALAIALGLLRCCWDCGSCRSAGGSLSIASPSAIWVAMLESGIDPVISGLAIGSPRVPIRRRGRIWSVRPTLTRASGSSRRRNSRARPSAGHAVGDLPQRAAAVRPAPVDQLRDRAAVRARQRRRARHAAALLGDAVVADHARDPVRLPRRQADRRGRGQRGSPRGRACTGRARRSARRCWWPAGACAGIGFTVSLLISSLAFSGQRLAEAKLGALATVVARAGCSTWRCCASIRRLPAGVRARQLARHSRGHPRPVRRGRPGTRPHPWTGRGPVTLVEYGDFECPYCGQAEQVVRELLAATATTCATSGGICRSMTST